MFTVQNLGIGTISLVCIFWFIVFMKQLFMVATNKMHIPDAFALQFTLVVAALGVGFLLCFWLGSLVAPIVMNWG